MDRMRLSKRQLSLGMVGLTVVYGFACLVAATVGVALSYADVEPAASTVISCGLVGLVGLCIGLLTNPTGFLQLRNELVELPT